MYVLKLRLFRVTDLLGVAFILALLDYCSFTFFGAEPMQISSHIGSQLVDLCSALLYSPVSPSWRSGGSPPASTSSRCIGFSRPDGSAGSLLDRKPSYLHRGGADRRDQSSHHPEGAQESHRASERQARAGDERQRTGRPADLRRAGDPGLLHHAAHHSLGFLLTRDSLAIALAIVLIGFFTMIARQKAVSQLVGFLVMENGLFLGATAATYGCP